MDVEANVEAVCWGLNLKLEAHDVINECEGFQPRSQGPSSLPSLFVGTETLVAAGHVTTQNMVVEKSAGRVGQPGFLLSQ